VHQEVIDHGGHDISFMSARQKFQWGVRAAAVRLAGNVHRHVLSTGNTSAAVYIESFNLNSVCNLNGRKNLTGKLI
jgi:hypothetical protein